VHHKLKSTISRLASKKNLKRKNKNVHKSGREVFAIINANMSRRQKISAIVLFALFLGLLIGFVVFKISQIQKDNEEIQREEERQRIQNLSKEELRDFNKQNLENLKKLDGGIEASSTEEKWKKLNEEIDVESLERGSNGEFSQSSWSEVNSEKKQELDDIKKNLEALESQQN